MRLFLTTIALIASISAAHAADGLYITTNDAGAASNGVMSAVSGSKNSLYIDQVYDGLGFGNQVKLVFTGNLNGGGPQELFTGTAAASGLTPGRIIQSGHGNLVDLFIDGNSNLFSSTQLGSANTLTAQTTGNYNQTAVLQMGVGNTASVMQNGNGNSLTIIQRSQ